VHRRQLRRYGPATIVKGARRGDKGANIELDIG
jgi:hypothetical protein